MDAYVSEFGQCLCVIDICPSRLWRIHLMPTAAALAAPLHWMVGGVGDDGWWCPLITTMGNIGVGVGWWCRWLVSTHQDDEEHWG